MNEAESANRWERDGEEANPTWKKGEIVIHLATFDIDFLTICTWLSRLYWCRCCADYLRRRRLPFQIFALFICEAVCALARPSSTINTQDLNIASWFYDKQNDDVVFKPIIAVEKGRDCDVALQNRAEQSGALVVWFSAFHWSLKIQPSFETVLLLCKQSLSWSAQTLATETIRIIISTSAASRAARRRRSMLLLYYYYRSGSSVTIRFNPLWPAMHCTALPASAVNRRIRCVV